jgi:hypothetical protein
VAGREPAAARPSGAAPSAAVIFRSSCKRLMSR